MDDTELETAGLRLDVDGVVATVTLDRPAVRNAQTPTMWRAMAHLGESLPDDVRVVVVRGAGGTFSAGLDRNLLTPGAGSGQESVADLLAADDATIIDTIADYQAGFTWLRDPRFISIALVQGHVIGAGFQLALACDLRIATDDVKLKMAEVALGLVPDLTGTKPLVEAVGYSRALEICTTARTVEADEALRIGLVLSVTPVDGIEETLATLVGSLTAPMVGAVRETAALIRSAAEQDPETQNLSERTAQARRFRELAAPPV